MLNLLNMDNLHFVFFISLCVSAVLLLLFFVSDRYRFILFCLYTVRSALVSGYIQGDIQFAYMHVYIYICI